MVNKAKQWFLCFIGWHGIWPGPSWIYQSGVGGVMECRHCGARFDHQFRKL